MFLVYFFAIGDDTFLKVIKLDIDPGRPNTLYATPGGDVFIRRDGSVQGPLKPREIQEWCNMVSYFGQIFLEVNN